jgi:hypothetical protein
MMVAPEIQPRRSRERHGEYRQGKIYGFIRAAQENQGFGSREDGHPPVREEERGNSQQRQLGLGRFSLGSGTGIQNGAGARGSGGGERLSVGDRDGCASALGCLHMNAQD